MYVSDLHPIDTLQGIGKAIGDQFRRRNNPYAEDLLSINPAYYSQWAEVIKGVTSESLENKFIPQARLIQLPSVDHQIAEGLVESDFKTYRKIVESSPDEIFDALLERESEGIIPARPDSNAISIIQLEAARLIGTGGIRLDIVDQNTGDKVTGADVELDGIDPAMILPVRTKTDQSGASWMAGLLSGKHGITITANGYKERIFSFQLKPGEVIQRTIPIEPGVTTASSVDEFEGDIIGPFKPGWRVRIKTVNLSELPRVPPAALIELEGAQAFMCSVLRKREGRDIFSYRFKIGLDQLPEGAKLYDVFVPSLSGEYELYDGTTADLRGDIERANLFGGRR